MGQHKLMTITLLLGTFNNKIVELNAKLIKITQC